MWHLTDLTLMAQSAVDNLSKLVLLLLLGQTKLASTTSPRNPENSAIVEFSLLIQFINQEKNYITRWSRMFIMGALSRCLKCASLMNRKITLDTFENMLKCKSGACGQVSQAVALNPPLGEPKKAAKMYSKATTVMGNLQWHHNRWEPLIYFSSQYSSQMHLCVQKTFFFCMHVWGVAPRLLVPCYLKGWGWRWPRIFCANHNH